MKSYELKPAKGLSEQFEVLKARVLSSLNGKASGPVVLAFTSCRAGEGVSCVAANFAATLSEDGDRNVLLADADLRRPSLHKLFPREALLGDDASDSNSKDDYKALPTAAWRVLKANDHLDVLILNTERLTNPQKVFGSGAFTEFLKEARKKYDFVILDCPPVHGSNGSTVIPARADAAVLVIEAERLRREVIQRSITLLEDTGTNILGVVLNKRRYPIPGFIYRML